VGAALLVLAAGLTLRVRLAWTGSIVLLLTGAVFVLLHGGLGWVAGTLVVTAALIAPFGRGFYRHANLLTGKLRAGTVLPLVTLIVCVTALAFFEPKLRWLDANAFWAVIISPDVPNSLRASLAVVVVLALAALWRLVRPARVGFLAWTGATAARFAALGARPPVQADGLVWGEAERAAIAFRRLDSLLLALGDPAGDPADRVSAIWRLRDLARQEGRNPAVWQAGRELLPVWGDLGLTALPLGADGLPRADSEDTPGPHADHFLVCQAERDLPALLPLLPGLEK
jgi:phosphatidylglycerol lysyltransferase